MKKTLLMPIILAAVTSISSFALDCNSIGEVKTYNGHYYAKTNQRTTFDAIRVSAMNDNGYLAIPNSEAENNFIQSMVGGNTESWIGIYDPNYSSNYCYDNAACSFDDLRFRDVKGQGITYKNWGIHQPNNFVEVNDLKEGVAEVNPLGENWVTMDGNTGKWFDVGNHKDSNQNPRKHIAVVEFDTKPICFLEDDGPSEVDFQERVCNTQVFDDNVANASNGVEANCLFDINGKEYCPQGLADAASYWAYIDGTALTNTATVTDFAQGESKEFTSSVRDFANSTSTRNSGTVIDYDKGNYHEYTGVVTDWASTITTENTATPIILGTWTYDWWNCDSCGTMPKTYLVNLIRAAGGSGPYSGAGVLNDSSKTVRLGINSTYIDIAPNQVAVVTYKRIGNASTGQYQSSGGKPMIHLMANLACNNWATQAATKDYPAHTYCADKGSNTNMSCPSGYTKKMNASGQYYCYYNVTTCPDSYQNTGSGCKKDINYKYYSYGCEEGYEVVNRGFTSFTKTDPDTSAVNWITLDDAVNDINPPAANCSRILNYNFYTYGCETGYVPISAGLTSCPRTDTSTSGVNSTLASDCNSPTPPAANCYKDISYKHYTYSCPAGYTIANYGLATCPKTDPNFAINNENSLNDSCNEAVAPIGNCSKNIEYAFYEYVCTGANNQFNEAYAAVSGGMTSCDRTDADLVNTNAELGNNCNDSVAPANNCRTTEYTCNSEIREPVFIDNKWQCSPYPCYGNENMEDLSQNVGSLDKDNNGWQEDGKCSGTIYIFNGKANECRSSDKFFGLAGGGCCKDDKYALGLLSCNAEEKELQIKKEGKKCHEVGEYCSKKISLGFAKICVRESKSYCCFSSTLARIIGEQGREQLTDIDWGTPENPNCRGFTVEEFQRLDLSQMDLTEFTESIELPDVVSKQETIVNKINAHVNLL